MGIQIKPRGIEIPESNPFENDLLNRKVPIEVLTHLVGSLEGPVVLSVDAAWGNGKTTFLKMWAQYLRNHDHPVVDFNAWETDFSGDPFLALSERITNGLLENNSDESLKRRINETKKVASEVLRHAVPAAIRVATAGILNLSPVLEGEIAQVAASMATDRLKAYEEARQSVKEFKESLENLTDELLTEDRHLVVMIDELDRCRPSYAVELLEVAKHLFSIDRRIVFVLAVNRAELAHSVKALYGREFDAHGYLDRFLDIAFRLPEPDRKDFIVNLLRSMNVNQRIEHSYASLQNPSGFLLEFFGASDLSLRKVEQAIHHFGLVLASSRADGQPGIVDATTAIVLIIRTFIPEHYYGFCDGQISDSQLVSELFKYPGTSRLSNRTKAIVAAAVVMFQFDIAKPSYEQAESSEMWTECLKAIETSDSEGTSYEAHVVQWIEEFMRGYYFPFLETSKRIELLAPELIQNPRTS